MTSLVHSGEDAVVPTAQAEKAFAHKAGDWAVWDQAGFYADGPDYRSAVILRVTKKTVITASPWGLGEYRRAAPDILWAGPESEARTLVERLVSSVGLMKDEVRRSRERHANRAAEIIAKAKGGAS